LPDGSIIWLGQTGEKVGVVFAVEDVLYRAQNLRQRFSAEFRCSPGAGCQRGQTKFFIWGHIG
jgi:hypothetical protein